MPPPTDAITDVEYSEEKLNEIVKGHYESQLLAKQHFEERKRQAMLEGIDSTLLPHERLPRPEKPPKFEVEDVPRKADDGASGS
jgi:hypothetical protein